MLIKIADIKFEEKKATEKAETEVKKIAESIEECGLIQPICVQRVNESQFLLTAGLTRLLATKMLGKTEIDATVSNVIDPVMAETVSIHENLKRQNLEWWQEVKLVESLHNLRKAQHDTREGSARPKKGEKSWGLRETAGELERSLGSVSQDLQLAKMVDLHPTLRNVKDKRTALKLINSEVKRIKQEEDAGLSEFSAIPLDDALCGDSVAVLKMLPPHSFDACITDPPWLKFQGQSQLEKDEVTDKVFREVFRVLRANTFLYAFVGFDDFYYYKTYLVNLGFTVSKTPLIWNKLGAMSPVGVAQWEYSRDFELILLAVKGAPALIKRTQKSGVFNFTIVPPRNMIHPHEKPVALIENLLEDCTYPGNTVLDPFGGSGAVAEACKKLKRPYLVIERDPEYFLGIRQRLGLKDES